MLLNNIIPNENPLSKISNIPKATISRVSTLNLKKYIFQMKKGI